MLEGTSLELAVSLAWCVLEHRTVQRDVFGLVSLTLSPHLPERCIPIHLVPGSV